ncbi:MAG: hypothetical protein IV100_01920 [Myxococcales bacterium]|nr:hypothetical protein [Myxococcales bacterium]
MSDGKLIPSHAARYLRVTELRERARQLDLARATAVRNAAQADLDQRSRDHEDAVTEGATMLRTRTDAATLALVAGALQVSGRAITTAEAALAATRPPEDTARGALQDAAQRRLAAGRWTADMKRAAIAEHDRQDDRAATDRAGSERSAASREAARDGD